MEELLFMISNRDINIPDFTELILNDRPARDFIVGQMVNNKNINVYYNCYLVSAAACEKCPDLFYEYLEEIIQLFRSRISYHHNIAMEFIGTLASVDSEDYSGKYYDTIISHMSHTSLVTKRYCVKSAGKIALAKPNLRNKIIKTLLSLKKEHFKNDRQVALLNSDIIEVLALLYPQLRNKKEVFAFVKSEAKSISPRTKKAVKEFLKKYSD